MEGTPAYMAPEQILGEDVDTRADLYAVGCILYEGVTGRVPLLGETPADLLETCVREEPIPPNGLVQGVPAALEELILRLLVKRPQERIGHARAVMAALSQLGAEAGDWAADQSARDYLYRPGFVGRDGVLERLEHHIREGRNNAARSADAFGFTPYAALPFERASWHHARTGDDSAAEAAFREAVARYRSWGALTLADRLMDYQHCRMAE